MKIIDLKDNKEYLRESIKLCSLEWGEPKTDSEMEEYINNKEKRILEGDKVISILGLVDEDTMIGFISLFKYEDDIESSLTPWYATMYVKQEFRGKGYSKVLNEEILKEAKRLGYKKVYLKSELVNYYEKFEAKHIEDLDNGEKLYYIEL
ncbi:MAG: GNAT family N-acetyltransferase [Bacilli bacterium]|nr:GNAT family N-acetyltransferase [Bacilli bacterium]